MDIGEMIASLSKEDIKSLQDMAETLMNGMSDNKTQDKANMGNEGGFDINAFSNIASVMSHLGSDNDPRCTLIMSLKPLLSPERQKRADEAIKILKIIEMVPVIRDSGLLKGVL